MPIPGKFQTEVKDEVYYDTETEEGTTETEEGSDEADDQMSGPEYTSGHLSISRVSGWSGTAHGIWTKVRAWCPTRGASPEPDVIEICAADDIGAAGIVQVNPDITVDSGAGASVANQAHFPHCVVEPSPGSEGGQSFIGASGACMPNRGQIKPKLILETGSSRRPR